jgi:hypothetical protein
LVQAKDGSFWGTTPDGGPNRGGVVFRLTVPNPGGTDITPPIVTVVAPATLEATGPDGAYVSFSATAMDPDDDAGPVNCSPLSGSLFPLGTTLITCASTDTHGNTGRTSLASTVRDTIPPTIKRVTPSQARLWPPNHRSVTITLTVDAKDRVTASPICQIVTVASNEPGRDQWTLTGPLSLNLIASRDGHGRGRIYTITVTCRDGVGNVSLPAVASVEVPHNHNGHDDKRW